MNECYHEFRHTERNPYRVVCDDCGSEVFSRGYWGQTVGDTQIEERLHKRSLSRPAEQTEEQKQRDGFIPPWPGLSTERTKERTA